MPDDGPALTLKAIHRAHTSIDAMIFRFDHKEIEVALTQAVARGVAVRALVAHLNRAGEDGLRALEQRLLAAGVSVARTGSDLTRYHGKVMIFDRSELHLFAFNFTHLDTERSRSFGLITADAAMVQEALELFEADSKRLPYESDSQALVISPVNARAQLAAFIEGAKSELLIYDPSVSDPAMIRLIEDRFQNGVNIRIIGKLGRKSSIPVLKLARLRLHTRTIVRDRRDAFVGSQSLRTGELDARREIGATFSDRKSVARLAKTFDKDWEAAQAREQASKEVAPIEKVAKKLAKAVVKDLPPVAPVLEEIIREMGAEEVEVGLVSEEVEASVKDAVKAAVREVITDAVENAAEQRAEALDEASAK
jgi:phosphatidylserine/phosphatidylglycerophosphate/cardiolipin synthase-like enzyme